MANVSSFPIWAYFAVSWYSECLFLHAKIWNNGILNWIIFIYPSAGLLDNYFIFYKLISSFSWKALLQAAS